MGLFRLLLALSVVFVHMGIWGTHQYIFQAQYAVEVFLFISGFYIFMILDSKKYTTYKDFILSRIFRIYPLAAVVLTLMLLSIFIPFFPFKYPVFHAQGQNIQSIIHYVVRQYTLFFVDTNYIFLKYGFNSFYEHYEAFWRGYSDVFNVTLYTSRDQMNGPTWTLTLELSFYIWAPLIFRSHRIVAFSLIALSLFDRFYFGDVWWLNVNEVFTSQISLFLLGSLSYEYIYKNISRIPQKWNYFLAILPFLALLLYEPIVMWALERYMGRYNSEFTLNILLFAVLIVSVPSLFYVSKNIKTDRFLGELSYPIYIIHYGVIHSSSLPHEKTIILIIVLSILAYFVVIRPIDRWRSRAFAKTQ